ncbi:MAG: hypothetical protein ACPGLY_23670 [Rubripirellula sp.]
MPTTTSNSSDPYSSAASQPIDNSRAEQSLLQLTPTQSQNLKCVFLGISVTLIIAILSSIVRGRGSLQVQLGSGGQNDFNANQNGPSGNPHGQGTPNGSVPQYVHQVPVGLPISYMQPMPIAVPVQMGSHFATHVGAYGQPGLHPGSSAAETSRPLKTPSEATDEISKDESNKSRTRRQVDSGVAKDRDSVEAAGIPIPLDRQHDALLEESAMDSTPPCEPLDQGAATHEDAQTISTPSTTASDRITEEDETSAESRFEIHKESEASAAGTRVANRSIGVVPMHRSDRGQGLNLRNPEEEDDPVATQGHGDSLFEDIIKTAQRLKRLEGTI